LTEINSIADGELTEFLQNFLEVNLPVSSKKKLTLGVSEEKLSLSIIDALKISCVRDSATLELLRALRTHFYRYIDKLSAGDLEKAQLGLAHSFSRSRVKFNINRVDNMIIHSICCLDQLDKDINVFAMRVKEWYAWHFPELKQIVEDNHLFAIAVKIIQSKSTIINGEKSDELSEHFDEITVKKIFSAAKSSMGTDISDIDLINIIHFATRVISLSEYRKKLSLYLTKKMNDIAPNLSALLGEIIGARLISQSGSLNSLAKQPSSTVQILGAEKALFRALLSRGNTPKHGLLFNSSFISRASGKDKGRMAKYLAAKTSIAARIDAFSDYSTNLFGIKLRELVEDRLQACNSGEQSIIHTDEAMKEISLEVERQKKLGQPGKESKKSEKKSERKKTKDIKIKEEKKKKEKKEEENESEHEKKKDDSKKKKKDKKKKKEESSEEEEKESAEDESESEEEDKKKKKKDKKKKEKAEKKVKEKKNKKRKAEETKEKGKKKKPKKE